MKRNYHGLNWKYFLEFVFAPYRPLSVEPWANSFGMKKKNFTKGYLAFHAARSGLF